MTVGDVLAEHDDNVITTHVAAFEMNLARGIQCDGEGRGVRLSHVDRAANRRRIGRWMLGGLAHLGHRDTADQPGVRVKACVNLLVLCGPVATRAIGAVREAARMQAAVD